MKTLGYVALVATLMAGQSTLAHRELPLGLDNNGQCVGDADGNATVQIHEIIQAINNALGGCARRPVTIEFRAMLGDQPFACGTAYGDIGTAHAQFIPSDWRFYVHDVRLVTADGREVAVELEQDGLWQYQNVALLDFENGAGPCAAAGNAATNTTVRGTVPAGVYTGAKFKLGLPFSLNHGDASTAPSPLNVTALFWSWQSGYKFVRVDTADDKYRIHLGSTGCESPGPSRPPTSCSAPNRASVALRGFDPDADVIIADLKALLQDSNVDSNQSETPPGCMSGPTDGDCAPVFAGFGLSFPGGQPVAGQRFFRSAAKHSDTELEHVELRVGSSVENGGMLVAHPEFDPGEPIPLPFAECLGGSGEKCDGGTRLFSAVNPGFEALEKSQPDESLYVLAEGTEITLALVGADPELSFRLNDTTLDVDHPAVLGSGTEFHADLVSQLALPGSNEPSGTFSASFKLTTSAAAYAHSEPFVLHFAPRDSDDHQ